MTVLVDKLSRRNRRLARQRWGSAVNPQVLELLACFSREFSFSISSGDLLLLDKGWYVTHTGLIRLARRKRCQGILVQPAREFCDPKESRWAFEATVYKSKGCIGFVGYGDADPSNVSFLVHGAEMRVAETRAVNRALRKAYGIGICSIEEIGSLAEPSTSSPQSRKLPPQPTNGNYGGRTVRDHLCQIIRQHQLDATLVKSYATDFCGVKTLREATREQVETFVTHLADWASKDRDALLRNESEVSERAAGLSLDRKRIKLTLEQRCGRNKPIFSKLCNFEQSRYGARRNTVARSTFCWAVMG